MPKFKTTPPTQLVLFFLCLVLFGGPKTVQAQDVKEFFGEDYLKAVQFVEQHQALFRAYCRTPNLQNKPTNPAIMASIVFPELVRHSRFQDFLETTALELAYVAGGKEQANFSIGHFQMRPSFVEQLETEAQQLAPIPNARLLLHDTTTSMRAQRSQRIARLKQIGWQLFYLQTFLWLAERTAPENSFRSTKDQLTFWAAYYNYGLTDSLAKVSAWQKIKAFPMGSHFSGKQYSYAEVSLYFFEQDAQRIFCTDSID